MKKPNMLFKVPGKKDRTIAVLFPNFWVNGFSILFQTMKDYAEKNSINLIVFQGLYRCYDSLNSETECTAEPGSIINNFINKDSVDGLIVCASAVINFSDINILCGLCDSFTKLPIVSIGKISDSIPYICVDNNEAVKSIIDHLVHVHNRKKIAYMRGPLDNQDSDERFEAFLKALSAEGISFNPDLVIINNVSDRKSASSSVNHLMQISDTGIDAILCCNDDQAKGVIDSLSEKEIEVPQDISVCGYYNDPGADAFYPGITSIDINFAQQGILAIRTICDSLDGISMNEKYVVRPSLAIRQSCGCLSRGTNAIEAVFRFRSLPATQGAETAYINLSAFSERLRADSLNAIRFPKNEQTESWCNELIDKFINIITHRNEHAFLLTFNNLLQQSSRCRCDLTLWLDIINTLDKSSGLLSTNDSAYCKSIVSKARIILAETIAQSEKAALSLSEERNSVINSLNHAFNTINSMGELLDILAADLPKIGILTFYLSIYENPDNPLAQSRLLLAFSRSGRRHIPENGIPFRTLQVIPDKFLPLGNEKALVLEPLYYKNNHSGFLLFESQPDDSSFYELFTTHLSAVVWNLNLRKNLIEAEAALKQKDDALAKTSDNLDIKDSVLGILTEKLENSMDMLLMSDKMASIGKLTAGIAHEMSTPIAAVRSSLGEIENLLHEYSRSIDDSDITPEDHSDIADDLLKSIELSESSVNHASEFIRSIKAQTRDNKLDTEIIFNLADVIKSVLTFLAYRLKSSNCHVSLITDDENIELYGSPAKMTQAVTNIITNAIDSLADMEKRNITIECRKKEKIIIYFRISDNGCGIPEENLKKIIEPLSPAKAHGTGRNLSLSIVNDIITNSFGGTVLVENLPEAGTTFTFTLNSIREYL